MHIRIMRKANKLRKDQVSDSCILFLILNTGKSHGCHPAYVCLQIFVERISKSMQIQNYELAYAGLKRMMESKIGISER